MQQSEHINKTSFANKNPVLATFVQMDAVKIQVYRDIR